MYKKLFAVLLALSMALSLAAGVSAEEAMSGSCGENAVWSFDTATGTLTISGTGSMMDYWTSVGGQEIIYNSPWNSFRRDVQHIVIEEGITRLGNDAFDYLPNLQSVVLPDTLTEIGNFVFNSCASLERIDLPEGLTTLGQECFSGTGLTTVEIPASVTFVDAGVFCSCIALTDAYFRSDPDSPGFVSGNSIFRGCTALEEIRVEEGHRSLRSIDGALYFRWDSGEMVLNSYPMGRENTRYRIADNTVLIGQFAFDCSRYLQNVIIPDTVTTVGHGAFMNCLALESVKFEGSAPEIEQNVFHCTNLTIYYPAGDASWDVRNTWSEEYLVGGQGSVTWEAYVPEIAEGICGDNATWHYKNGKLTISGSGELYDKWTIDNEEWSALKDQITHVVVEEGITYIGSYSFGWCRNLTSVTLSDTVTDIGDAAFFYCEALESLDLPQGLTSIGNNAFAHSGLNKIEIPENVTFLGADAFGNCESLTDVLVLGDPDLPGMVTGNSVFLSCDSLAEIQVEEDHPFLRSIDGALYIEDHDGSLHLNSYPAGRQETAFELAEHTVSIEQYAFRDALWLEEVLIPATVSSVGSGAFMDNRNLKQVSFAGSAPEFGEMDMFTGCTLTVRYPVGDPSWDGRDSWVLGGSITWTAWNPANPFGDVPVGVFYEAPVLWAVEQGITAGTSGTTFSPNNDCLRAQVVTFLWRAAGSPEPASTGNPFVDVKPEDFYYKAVLWAVEKGITNGADAAHFNPLDVCNRAQVVTFLYRTFGNPAVENTSSPFTDVTGDTWYAAPVLWAVEQQITNGISASEFGPNANCSRAQIVTFLYRAYH